METGVETEMGTVGQSQLQSIKKDTDKIERGIRKKMIQKKFYHWSAFALFSGLLDIFIALNRDAPFFVAEVLIATGVLGMIIGSYWWGRAMLAELTGV